MNRYVYKLLHWKNITILKSSQCYSGDSYSDNNTRLGMEIRYKEYELEQLEAKKDKTYEEQDSIEKISCKITQ